MRPISLGMKVNLFWSNVVFVSDRLSLLINQRLEVLRPIKRTLLSELQWGSPSNRNTAEQLTQFKTFQACHKSNFTCKQCQIIFIWRDNIVNFVQYYWMTDERLEHKNWRHPANCNLLIRNSSKFFISVTTVGMDGNGFSSWFCL